MPLRLYNTLTRRVEPLVPRDPAHVTFYTCGPTVYDDAHIGNFRAFLAADVLRRWIESPLCELADGRGGVHRGPRRVTHVMNITDVGHMTDDAEGGEGGEDRMAVAGRRLAEAKKAGAIPAGVEVNPGDPYQIARFYESRFRDDAKKLGLKVSIEADADPTLHPRATDNIPGMIDAIRRLLDRGCAYVVGTPGSRVVYFAVQTFPPYGRLSGNSLERLREGEGGRISAANQAGKRHPADFLLWKEDPSHIMKWDSPWGTGYPGWHIECTVMSVARLLGPAALSAGLLRSEQQYPGAIIDLHSGGEDNIFPHHECEIAQSCCAYTDSTLSGTFARHWFHARFLLVEGDKMSKSKGNFFTPRDLFARGVEPAALRLELIRTHYRSNANFTMQGLTDGARIVERWRRFRAAAPPHLGGGGDRSAPSGVPPEQPATRAAREDFTAAMNDDLNVAGAVAAVNTWIAAVPSPGPAEAALLDRLDAVLALLALPRPLGVTSDIGLFAPGVAPDPVVIAKLEERRAARAAKDFKTADAIRADLLALGYAIKDAPGGKVEVSRAP